MACGWLAWALHGYGEWHRTLWLLAMVPCGALIFYSLRFFFSATAVIFTRAENMQYLWYHLYKLGMRPDSIYVPWLKIILLTAIPVALIASVPARMVLGSAGPLMALWVALVAGILLVLSSLFWNYSLRHYASASS
jgi:ABC-2 type transport system permease protein